MGDQQNLYTLAEAAQLTGLSTEALRLRIKRGKLEAEKGNDGHPRVRLTSANLEEFRRQIDQQNSTLNRQDSNKTSNVIVLADAVMSLREQLERAEAAIMVERARADRAEAELAAVRARAVQAERDREAARVQAAEAAGEVRGLREALAEARRPFWRRWIGG